MGWLILYANFYFYEAMHMFCVIFLYLFYIL